VLASAGEAVIVRVCADDGRDPTASVGEGAAATPLVICGTTVLWQWKARDRLAVSDG
jgi:hypothetical protein